MSRMTLEKIVDKTLAMYDQDPDAQWTECAEKVLEEINWRRDLDNDAIGKLLVRGLAGLTIDKGRNRAAEERRAYVKENFPELRNPARIEQNWQRIKAAHDLLKEHKICCKPSCVEDKFKMQSCTSFYFRSCDVVTMSDSEMQKVVASIVRFKKNQEAKRQREQEALGRDLNRQVKMRSLECLRQLIGPEQWDGFGGRKVNPLDLNEEDEDYIISNRQSIIAGHTAVISWIQETRAIVQRERVASRTELSEQGLEEACRLTIKYLATPGRGRRSPKASPPPEAEKMAATG